MKLGSVSCYCFVVLSAGRFDELAVIGGSVLALNVVTEMAVDS